MSQEPTKRSICFYEEKLHDSYNNKETIKVTVLSLVYISKFAESQIGENKTIGREKQISQINSKSVTRIHSESVADLLLLCIHRFEL
jgi:hypothetical protein